MQHGTANNANSVYSSREQTNGASDAETLSYGGVIVNLGNAEWDRFTVIYAFSVTLTEEKLMLFIQSQSNTAGAGWTHQQETNRIAKLCAKPRCIHY